MSLMVAKVGGSLLDWPELGERLRRWRAPLAEQVVLVTGGGAIADVIREAQQIHQLTESAAHWVAIRTMTLNAHLLATITGWPVVTERTADKTAILDVWPFCSTDDPQALAHSWQVTSDSIAARIARVWQANLTLLKSTELTTDDWAQAAVLGLVDDAFPEYAREQNVRWVNLRR